jgi:superfamily II DNA or RNA helicase
VAKLEQLTPATLVKGIVPDAVAELVSTKWHGSDVLEVVYKDSAGRVGTEILFRDREPSLEIVTAGRPWSFDGDGKLFRLVSEAHRIRLAHLFDPLVAVHTSLVEPLPHQILAVYEAMLPRQPLRFLLADDPGAGKTIMAGLFIKELLIRGDLQRCLVVSPGNLAEQWQDELWRKFNLPFEIATNDKLEAARTGNWFRENSLCIARLDKLSRDEEVQAKLKDTEWDLIVCDEAHKMSATFFGGEVKYTKRYHLGRLLGGLTRHFLLMTATPHNGKEEDFQLFMALLDADRFEGKFRDGVHTSDVSDLMRRMVKENLLKFDGTPLFPERIAYTVNYKLSDGEARLYKEVTEYVQEQFNLADRLASEGRQGTVGFALTSLQRRLASSPEAIYQSLRRRRERLEKRLREEQLLRRGAAVPLAAAGPSLTPDDIDELDDAPDAEVEATENQIIDQATAAQTIAELEKEIAILRRLENVALEVRRSGKDRKWDEFSALLQNNEEMFDAHGHRRKLILFTEHRDTLNYLAEKIRGLLGKPETVVVIHGSLGREERTKAQDLFTQDKDVQILVATDAAGEGVNLQRAHLMVNYDLPWNPNRIEQRFGRIHRIGQTEVCHLWNLVAAETREGAVYQRLLEKLAQEREALGGQVFDVLGKVTFDGRTLRELLMEAIRYGDRQEVRDRLFQIVENALDHEKIRGLVEERALAHDVMDATKVRRIRETMERAEARRLQPHFIESYFLAAFQELGGTIREREPRRYEITHVPAVLRQRDRHIGIGDPILSRYERITFEKTIIAVPGKPLAEFISPGHPLLQAVSDVMLERHRDLLKRGAVLVDDRDDVVPLSHPMGEGSGVRALLCLEHAIQDARTERGGVRRVVSRQMQFVEMDAQGNCRPAGYAPYLDYRPLKDDELAAAAELLREPWLNKQLEQKATSYAIAQLLPRHIMEVRDHRLELIDRTRVAVTERLTKEINHWDHRAQQLRLQESAGQTNARLNSDMAQRRADELQARLQNRMRELDLESQLSPLPPVVLGGAIIVPARLLQKASAPALRETPPPDTRDAEMRRRVELLAMQAVLAAERQLGFEPSDVSADNRGYDVESRIPNTGKLRFIEVKGRAVGAGTVTITRNEIMTALNKPDDFILAIVTVDGDKAEPRYVRQPFKREPDFAVTSVNYIIRDLLAGGTIPS